MEAEEEEEEKEEEGVHVVHGGERRGVYRVLVGETREKETNWET
jgi:hypothetical protein